jgi:hypothetical protein
MPDLAPVAPVITEHGLKWFLVLFALTMIGIVVFARWRAGKLSPGRDIVSS